MGSNKTLRQHSGNPFANNTMFACALIWIQMTVRPRLVLQRRRVSAVHLAGSSIPTRVHTALAWSMQQHRSNVLMHVLLTPAVTVFPSICKIATTCSVMYMTGILAVVTITLQHCLKSSGSVMQNQVCDVTALVRNFPVENFNRLIVT